MSYIQKRKIADCQYVPSVLYQAKLTSNKEFPWKIGFLFNKIGEQGKQEFVSKAVSIIPVSKLRKFDVSAPLRSNSLPCLLHGSPQLQEKHIQIGNKELKDNKQIIPL